MSRSTPLLRTAAVAATLVALAGCSFRGSADDPDARGSSSSSSSSAASSPAPAPASGTSAAGGSTSAGQPAGGAEPSTGHGPSGGQGGSTTGSGGGTPAVDRCHTSELTGSLVPGDSGAGQRYATLVLKDTGGQTCTINGFGGLGLVDAAGKALPSKQVRAASPAPALVTLKPGATVQSQLHWGAVSGTGDSATGPCQPTPAALTVIPPDETDALRVAWQGGPVCEGGTIQQQAYTAG
jgi:Protein of unknown function (DUF4232)